MKAKTKIKHSSPYIDQKEVNAITEILKRGILSTGEIVSDFEKRISRVVGVKYACAVSSGSAALFLTIKKLPEVFPELKGKDEVIIPSFSCFALSNAVLMNQMKPAFADINIQNFSLDPQDIKKNITKRTLCVVFVHSFGICSDIKEIVNLGIPVIEDIAQSFGGKVDGRPAGSFGLASISSFYATKVITTGGEGGAVLSNNRELIEKIKDFIDYDKKTYEKEKLRFNFKMTDLNAAIGIVQLKKLKEILQIRRKIAEIYIQNLEELEKEDLISLPPKQNNIFFRFPILLKKGRRDELIEYLNKKGVSAQKSIFRPIHFDIEPELKLKNTEIAYENSVSIPIHPNVKEKDAYTIPKLIKSFLFQKKK